MHIEAMNSAIIVCDKPTDADRDAILAPLAAFNAANGYPADPHPVALLLHDDVGNTVGGLWGRTVYDWLFIDYLFVPATMRGGDLGSHLIAKAETIAVDRGCVGLWLTTFTFQARGFYEKLGYTVFGNLKNSPGDNVRIFMQKRLDPPGDRPSAIDR